MVYVKITRQASFIDDLGADNLDNADDMDDQNGVRKWNC